MFINDLVKIGAKRCSIKNNRVVLGYTNEDKKFYIKSGDGFNTIYFFGTSDLILTIEIGYNNGYKHEVYFSTYINERLTYIGTLFSTICDKIEKFINNTLVNYDEDEYVVIFENIFRISESIHEIIINLNVNPCTMKSARY
jgi:hypothetical protein